MYNCYSFFRLSNFAVINDGVLAATLNFSITLIGIWATVVKRFSVGEVPLQYYICTGIDPNKGHGPGNYHCSSKKYNASLIVWVFCLFLHIVLMTKIFCFQRKAEKKVRPIELGVLKQNNTGLPNQPISVISCSAGIIQPSRQIR